VLALVLLAGYACTQEAKDQGRELPVSSTVTTEAFSKVEVDPGASASKRMLGRWRMDLQTTPDSALTKEFLDLKRKGKSDQVRIEYVVTDTEFILDTYGLNRSHIRWHYEILREGGDGLHLKKTEENGQTSEIAILVKGVDELVIGTGSGQVPLKRVP
jgi:hypothetical protein